MFAQGFGGVADFTFAGQEHQNVAGADAVQFIAGIDNGLKEIAFVLILLVLHGPVANFHRIHPARHLDHRRTVEVLRKTRGVDGRRGDDQLEIRAFGQKLFEVAEQEIDVQAAFMRFVDDQRVVLQELRIALRFGEQNAIRHQLDVGLRRSPVSKANLVADQAAQLAFQFLCDTCGGRAGGDTARLRMADQPADTAPQIEAEFRQLRRLARSGFAADDDDLMLLEQRSNFLPTLVDRQFLGKFRAWQPGPTHGNGRTRFFQQRRVLRLQGVALDAKDMTQVTRHRPQATLVGGKAIAEFGFLFQGWQTGGKVRDSTKLATCDCRVIVCRS